MNRQHPLFSPIGCAGGLVLIVGILLAVWFSGGAIFSPGDLTAYAQGNPINGFASHADFQNDCTQCHAPGQGIVPERCETCHTNIQQERTTATGLHGKLKAEEVQNCAACHTDHKGKELNPNATAIKRFDHSILGFSLARHVADYAGDPLACKSCHTATEFKFEATMCVQCHSAHDGNFMADHTQAFGQACSTCHDGLDKTASFDHAQTDFPLMDQHAELACAACHTPATPPAQTPVECAACHQEPAGHAQVFSNQSCDTCHTPTAWLPAKLGERASFTHADIGFQLIHHLQDFAGAPITCADCHVQASAGDFSVDGQACVNCHNQNNAEFMTQHVQKYGLQCASCHDGAGNMTNFDHSQVFALDGAHAALECGACHQQQKFRGTPRECAACHQEPQIHAGVFGTQCEACHTTTAWAPAQLTRHTFPLNHGEQGEIDCATCHTQSYITYTCAACHAPDEMQDKHNELGLSAERLQECAVCHAIGRTQEHEGQP